MRTISPDALHALERHFHAVIRERAGAFLHRHETTLPALTLPLPSVTQKSWFPVPGMYGGFSFWAEDTGAEATGAEATGAEAMGAEAMGAEAMGADVRLVVESWSRVVGGSGQRHLITAHGSTLVAEGFV